jgi:hypothetical protein
MSDVYMCVEPPSRVEIELEDFESRARELDIADLQPFLTSPMFAASFTLQQRGSSSVIVHLVTADV